MTENELREWGKKYPLVSQTNVEIDTQQVYRMLTTTRYYLSTCGTFYVFADAFDEFGNGTVYKLDSIEKRWLTKEIIH